MRYLFLGTLISLMSLSVSFAQEVEQSPLDPLLEEAPDEEALVDQQITEDQKIDHIAKKIIARADGNKYLIDIAESDEEDNPVDILSNIESQIHLDGPEAILQYHDTVRTLAKDNQDWSEKHHLFLNVNEIEMLSQHLEWRSMRLFLLSLDRITAAQFPVWSKHRVESWLVQAEVMNSIRPEGADKTNGIEYLIAKIRLAQKTNEKLEIDYTIEDRIYRIETGEKAEVFAKKEEEPKKGFFGNLAKKLKFWD